MVIFGTGVVTGGLLVRHSEHIRVTRPLRNSVAGRPGLAESPGGIRVDFLRRAGRELQLTPEQRERLDKVIKESQERTRKVMAPFLHQELQRAKDELREILTPEQRTRFEQVLKQQQEQQERARQQHRPQPMGDRLTNDAPPGAGPPPPPR
jgi:Spy/CpxP family protein refolding chaperone